MRGVISSHVEIHYVTSMAWGDFGQHKLRYILCADILGIWLTQVFVLAIM